jgi:predicted nucleotidyltransferase
MKTIEDLKKFLIKTFLKKHIYLFGSRAKQAHRVSSDIDIAIKSKRSISKELAFARFEIEESQIPYKVDLIELSKAPYLEEIIKKEGIRWH